MKNATHCVDRLVAVIPCRIVFKVRKIHWLQNKRLGDLFRNRVSPGRAVINEDTYMDSNHRDQDILVLDSQLTFKGHLQIGPGRPVAIAGPFAGSIRAEGEVRILKGSVTAASIEAKTLVVAGTVETDQFVKVEKLVIEASGILSAPRIQYEALEIQLGGRLVGNLHSSDLTFPSVSMKAKEESTHPAQPPAVQQIFSKPESVIPSPAPDESLGVASGSYAPAVATGQIKAAEAQQEAPPAPLDSIDVLPFLSNLPSSNDTVGAPFRTTGAESHREAERASA